MKELSRMSDKEIEKTAASIGFTLEDVLQLMAENACITELRSKTK